VLKDRRALGGRVRLVHERVLTAAVPKLEEPDKVAQEAHVVLLDVDGGGEARGERGGVVQAVECNSPAALSEWDIEDEGSH
jgi:hypothetical protein